MRKKQIFILIFLFALLVQTGFVLTTNAEDDSTNSGGEVGTSALSSAFIYTVQLILDGSAGSTISYGAALLETNDFNQAYAKMQDVAKTTPNVVVRATNSLSPTKIVASDRARVQSYPYRTGRVGSEPVAKNTLNIYSNKALTSATTYVAPHYQMAYYGTSTASATNNQLVVEMEINGARGYVDLAKADIIPLKVFEQKLLIPLGGDNGDYYKPAEKVETFSVVADTYVVARNNNLGVNEISLKINRTYPTLNPSTTTYAIAPNWLPVGVYYSSNGINFYTDIDMKNPVNNGASFYAYYQWLPVRTLSNTTADILNAYITNLGYTAEKSVIVGNEQIFIENGNLYGMNALLVFAQASLESAYGSSSIAKTKYNLFGWDAVDSNTDLASSYDGVEASVVQFMSDKFQGYFLFDNWRNFGMSYGNKGAGVTVKYASDPYYGTKVAGIAYNIDRANGFKDYDAYTLSLLKNNTAIPLYKGTNTGSGTWYSSKNNIVNQIVTNLGESNGYIKTNLSQPIKNNAVTKEELPVNLLTEFGYIPSSFVTSHLSKTLTTTTAKVPTERIVVNPTVANYVTNDNLNLRSSWTTASRVITTIPTGTNVLSSGISSNGWVRVNYNGQIGYLSSEYITAIDPSISYKLGDVDNNGSIGLGDLALVKAHLLGNVTLSGNAMIAADVDKSGSIGLGDLALIKAHLLGNYTIK